MSTIKHRLAALEAKTTTQACGDLTEEEKARRIRMGLSESPTWPLCPADVRRLREIIDGNYPETMTADDVTWVRQANHEIEDRIYGNSRPAP